MQPPAAGDNARGAEPGPGGAQETAGAASFGVTGAGATVWRSIGSSHLSTPWLDVSAHRRPPWECTMARLIASPDWRLPEPDGAMGSKRCSTCGLKTAA